MIHSEGFSEAPTFRNCTANLNSKAGLYMTFQNRGARCKCQRFMKKAGRGMRMRRKSLMYSRFRVKKTCMTEGEGVVGAIVPFWYGPIKLS